jgi:soluble calcium-activated nucleotidase 1
MVPLSKRSTGATLISLQDSDYDDYSDHQNIVIDNNDDVTPRMPRIDSKKSFSKIAKKITRRWSIFSRRTLIRSVLILGLISVLLFILYLSVDWRSILDHESFPEVVKNAMTQKPVDAAHEKLLKEIEKDKDRNEFELVAVADRDAASFDKTKHQWLSILLRGKLARQFKKGAKHPTYSVSWQFDTSPQLRGAIAEGTRGMELSELKRYHNKLFTFDDRTGTVFEVLGDNQVVPRHILSDGDGNSAKGFKCEWATVKDNKLYVGSIGKEWTNPKGEVTSRDPTWIKVIDENGKIEHVDWNQNYEKLRSATNSKFPGYLIHEAVEWSEYHKRWFFLPRRVSNKPYDMALDEQRGSNVVISVSENFDNLTVKRIGKLTKSRGFSTVKFVPGRPNEMIAVSHSYVFLANFSRSKQKKLRKKKK